MTLLQGLFSGRTEGRAVLDDPAIPLTADTLLDFIHGEQPADAGVVVTEQSSMQVAAVWRCVSVTAGVASALPLKAFASGTRTPVPADLLADPHPEMTPLELWRLAYTHRLLWGNSCLQKMRNGAGQVRELWPISPTRVRIGRVRPTDANPGGKIFAVTNDWGETVPMTTRDILHIPGLSLDGVAGLSPIGAARMAIGLSQAAEKSGARFFGRGAQMSGVLQVDQALDDDQAATLQRRWEARTGGLENAGKVPVLDMSAKFQPITMPLRDAQFLETRQFQVPEVARFFGTPLFLLFETQKTTSWGTGLEQQALGWVVFDLHPTWLAPTEQRVSKELLGKTQEARYNVNGLMRGDSAARSAFYQVMRTVGAYSANDIRELEDLEPVEDGDGRLQPLNMGPLGGNDDAAEARAITEMVQKVYLGVGTVLSEDEARQILNQAGANLPVAAGTPSAEPPEPPDPTDPEGEDPGGTD